MILSEKISAGVNLINSYLSSSQTLTSSSPGILHPAAQSVFLNDHTTNTQPTRNKYSLTWNQKFFTFFLNFFKLYISWLPWILYLGWVSVYKGMFSH